MENSLHHLLMTNHTAFKRGEIRKQAKTLISSRFKDSGQTGYK